MTITKEKPATFLLDKMKPTECAPKTGSGDGVCSSEYNIEKIKEAIQAVDDTFDSDDKKQIIEAGKKITECTSESCVVAKLPETNKAELDSKFNPEGPFDSTSWLSNDNIDAIGKLYMKLIPKYYHHEFQMRDFVKCGGSLTKWDSKWEDALKKLDYFSCVFNTDLTGNRGKHWVAFFVDFRGRTVEFFDSAATNPPLNEFCEYVISVVDRLNRALGKKEFHEVYVVNVRHQKENSECGVYSLYYILSRLHGVPYEAFKTQSVRLADEDMIAFRRKLFRWYKD